MPPLLSNLNPEQLEAVTSEQSALVLAGAGSGKTRVLTTRIAHLIQSGQARPNDILAMTFTNKAAKEMLIRIAAMLPVNPRGMWIGTFHGLCNRMLRAHYQDAGLPHTFQILDSSDQLGAIKRILKNLGIDDEKFPPRQVQWFINNAKEEGLRSSRVEAHDSFTVRMVELYTVYEQQCNKEGIVDFAELLLRSHELLTRNEPLREHYRNRFRHILIDEFQDTSKLQYQWLRLLTGKDATVFAVGDDDQSIYAFRGANTGNMKQFERDFRIASIIRLEQNYRSHGNILDAANALIRNNSNRLGKTLWTAEDHGELLNICNAATDFDEAAFIISEIKSLHSTGTPLSQIALLYRSNAQSRVLEQALFNAALPYRVYGGMRFFERQEIRHALAYLRLILNPEDDSALLRVVNFPARGIGARSMEQLQHDAIQSRSSLWVTMLQKYRGSTPSLHQADSGLLPPGKPKKGIESFVVLIETLREACKELPLPEIISCMLEHSGLTAHYQTEREGADRLENLNELVNAATSFVHEAEDDSLVAFLTHASLEAGEHQADNSQETIQLMTVHASKGLEFHAVFLSGLEEGLFPHENSRNEAGGLEEERRLMYVALTRARRRLYLSFSHSRMLHGQTRNNPPSRFLQEIPVNLLKWQQPVSRPEYRESPERYLPHRGAAVRQTATGITTPAATPQQMSSSPWRIGQNVSHAKFGTGVITQCEGQGTDARVQVTFSLAGTKWLSLEYARLVPA